MASITIIIEDDEGQRTETRSEFVDGLLTNKGWTRREIQRMANAAKSYFDDAEEVTD